MNIPDTVSASDASLFLFSIEAIPSSRCSHRFGGQYTQHFMNLNFLPERPATLWCVSRGGATSAAGRAWVTEGNPTRGGAVRLLLALTGQRAKPRSLSFRFDEHRPSGRVGLAAGPQPM